MAEFDYGCLLDGLNIEKGDIIDVASDMASIILFARNRKLDFNIDHLIDFLKEAVGNDGTVMIRAFSWDFCKGVDFDIKTSPSKVGMLGNYAIKRSDFKRSAHPIYSWMVWGKYADELLAMNNTSAFGKATPFAFLYEHYGKQISLGNINGDSCTQLHHAEAVAKAPYRFDKPFTGKYTDYKGITSSQNYSMHVRPFDVSVEVDTFDEGERYEFLANKGIIKKSYVEDVLRIMVIDEHALEDFVVDDLIKNDGINMVSVNGKRGFRAAGVDYSKVRFV